MVFVPGRAGEPASDSCLAAARGEGNAGRDAEVPGRVVEDEALIQDVKVKRLLDALPYAMLAERHDTLPEAICLNLPDKRITALDVKPSFRPRLRVWVEDNEPEAPLRFGNLVHGDPEGIRTPDLHRDRVAC